MMIQFPVENLFFIRSTLILNPIAQIEFYKSLWNFKIGKNYISKIWIVDSSSTHEFVISTRIQKENLQNRENFEKKQVSFRVLNS